MAPFQIVFADDSSPVVQHTALSDTSTVDISAPTSVSDSQKATPVTDDIAQLKTQTGIPDTVTQVQSISKDTKNIDSVLGQQMKLSLPVSSSEAATAGAVSQPDAPQSSLVASEKLLPTVDNQTGALTYAYPIALPPGRNGMTPSLSISYNSQNTINDNPLVGYGWNLSIPYIARVNTRGSNTLYDASSTTFTTSDNGLLSQITATTYGLHTDEGSLSSYTYINNKWVMITKSGVSYTYGSTPLSRQDDPTDTTHIYKWLLDSITDTNGNSITYTYFKDGGQIYPDTIVYTNAPGSTGIFLVTFSREHIPKPSTLLNTGFPITTQYRINKIDVSISGTVRHSYSLTYGVGSNTTRSLLLSVTESGYDTQGNIATPFTTTFKYQQGQNGFSKANTWNMPQHFSGDGSQRQDAKLGDNGDFRGLMGQTQTGILVDVNGDGKLDWVETENPTVSSFGDYTDYYAVWLNTSNGWIRSDSWSAAMPRWANGNTYQVSPFKASQLIDINGDGLPDWVNTTGDTVTNDNDNVWLNTGTGWVKSSSWTMPTITAKDGTIAGVKAGGQNQLIDINGDGLPDFVQTTSDNLGTTGTSTNYGVWLNTGNGWKKTPTFAMPLHKNTDGTFVGVYAPQFFSTAFLVDINGDTLPDWVETNYTSTKQTYDVWINTGTSWIRNTSWTMPIHTPPDVANTAFGSLGGVITDQQIICNSGSSNSYVCGDRNGQFSDVNGDGLTDWIETTNFATYSNGSVSSSEYNVVWINNGHGWVKSTSWNMPKYANLNGPGNPIRLGNDGFYSSQLADINGDGLPDWISSCNCGVSAASANRQTPQVLINTGSSWIQTDWQQPMHTTQDVYTGAVLGAEEYVRYPYISIHRMTELQDINNDGVPDWVESTQFQDLVQKDAHPSTERDGVWINTGVSPDLLSSISLPLGASIDVTYGQQSIIDKGSAGGTQDVLAVTNMTLHNGDTPGVTTYTYSGGKYFYSTNNLLPRRFAGFHIVTTTKPDTSIEIDYFNQGDTTDKTTYEYTDAEAEIGKLYRTDISNAAGKLYTRTITKYDFSQLPSLNNDRYFVYPSQTISETFDGTQKTTTDKRQTAKTFSYDSTTGNLIRVINYGEVVPTIPLSTLTDTGNDMYTTTYVYAKNTIGTMYGVSDEKTVDISGNVVTEIRHYYDGQPIGSLTLGNETKTEQWKSDTTFVGTQKKYNSYGLVIASIDPLGDTTKYNYDTNNLYSSNVVNALSQKISYQYDLMFGKAVQVIDQNGYVSQTGYDGYGRMTFEKVTDPSNVSALINKTTYRYDDDPFAAHVSKSDYYANGGSEDESDFMDHIGQIIQIRIKAEPAGFHGLDNYDVRGFTYDNMGRVVSASLPATGLGAEQNNAPDSSLWTTYTYDILGRMITATNALGTLQYQYDKWKLVVTDMDGNKKNYYSDAYGNLIKVEEINKNVIYTTMYGWDFNGNVISITDASGNIRHFTYDGLSERTAAEDLHAPTDTTFGIWKYTYDTNGNILQTISPKKISVLYTYDVLDRILSEDASDATGIETTYTYDKCTNGVGKICSTILKSGLVSQYTYDTLGNIVTEKQILPGNTSNPQFAYTYDQQGNLLTITYPDAAQIRYNYTSFDKVASIDRKEKNTDFVSVISNINYTPDSKIANFAYANGVTVSKAFDPARGYRLTHAATTDASGKKLQDLTYTYDNMDNITKIVDASATNSAKTSVFVYDNLYRILSATITGTANKKDYTENYTYDPLGNILTKNGAPYLYQGNTGTNFANPDAATSINGTSYIYDNDSNLISNGTLVNTFDYKDELLATTIGAKKVSYQYDQSGNRVSLANGTTTTYYPNRYYSFDATKKTKQVYLGDMLVATVETNGKTISPYYVSSDAILGTNIVTDAKGAQTELLDYTPFGDIRLDEKSGTTNFSEQNKFSGYTYDVDTDLNYLGARYYNAKAGRFVSEDPLFWSIGAQLMDPQAMNAYSYVENNPLVKRDPTGRTPEQVIDGSITGLGMGIFYLAFGVANTIVHPINFIESIPNIPSEVQKQFAQYGQSIANGGDYERGYAIAGSAFFIGSILDSGAVGAEGDIAKLSAVGSGVTKAPAILCRAGVCEAETFRRGSDEYKAGLNPGLDDPLTGVSFSKVTNVDDLAKTDVIPGYRKYGDALETRIIDAGGTIIDTPKPLNGFHVDVNHLSANKLSALTKPNVKLNPFFKLKK